MKTSLTEGSVLKSLTYLAVPIVFANILQTAYQLTDTFWVGRLGASAVAAVSLAFPIIFLLISVGTGFTVAGTVLVSQYAGQKRQAQVDLISGQTFFVMTVLSLVISVIGYLGSPFVIDAMGASPEVRAMAVPYLEMSFIGLFFMYSYIMFQSLFRGVGNITSPLYIVLFSVLLNFVLDPLFILGWGPIAPRGVSGAALATIATQALSAFIGIGFMVRGRSGINLKWKNLKPNWSEVGRIFRLGLPASAEQSTRALGMLVMMFLVTSFGVTAVASYGIVARILSFVIIPALGFSMATSTLVGQNIGAGKIDRAKEVAHVSCLVIFVALTLVGALTFIFADQIVYIFLPSSPEVISQGAFFMRILSFSFGLIGLQQVISGALRGGGNTLMAMMIAIVALWVVRFPVAYILSNHTVLGVTGIWISFPVGNALGALIAGCVLMRGNWLKRLTGDFDEIERQVIEENRVDDTTSE